MAIGLHLRLFTKPVLFPSHAGPPPVAHRRPAARCCTEATRVGTSSSCCAVLATSILQC